MALRPLKVLAFIIFLLSTLSISAHGQNILYTEIEKNIHDEWTVTYQSSKQIQAVMFANSPDSSRLQRWRLLSTEFSFNYINGKEVISRKDGTSFTSIKLKLTPNYVHLPKNYAPFSPFSNDGMLVHSGRFFACANICSGRENIWAMAVKAPRQDNIVVDGKVYLSETSWWDKNEGQKFYIGKQVFEANIDYNGIIDPLLIGNIGKQLQETFPSMMAVLEKSYGALQHKPMLFASVSSTNDGSFGRQGGTLPNQIFMHWYGDVKHQKRDEFETLWFFAHEAAHMYQNLPGKAITPVDNWLHEGHAEMMAKKIIISLLPQYSDLVAGKVSKAEANCEVATQNSSLSEQVKAGNYQSLYDCGLYIFNMIDFTYQGDNGVEALWLEFIKQASNGHQINSNELISLAQRKYHLANTQADGFRKIVGIN